MKREVAGPVPFLISVEHISTNLMEDGEERGIERMVDHTDSTHCLSHNGYWWGNYEVERRNER